MMRTEPSRIASLYLARRDEITTEQVGRRVYLRGNTYPFKDDLKALGAKWDRDERAWWISTTKFRRHKKEIEEIIESASIPRSTRKQVDFLVKLHDALQKPYNRRDLERLPMSEAGKLISQLKEETSSRATHKQVDYLETLHHILQKPYDRQDLERLTRKDAEKLISQLKEEILSRPNIRPRTRSNTPSERQIDYAMSLLRRLSPMDRPSRKDLENLTRHQISDFISKLREF